VAIVYCIRLAIKYAYYPHQAVVIAFFTSFRFLCGH